MRGCVTGPAPPINSRIPVKTTPPSVGYQIAQTCVPSGRIFQTVRVSPGCKVFRERARAGRLIVVPDSPSSLKTVLHPARLKAVSCRAGTDRLSRPGRSHISWLPFCD